MDQIPLQLDREGIKERDDGERGWGRLFQIFPSKEGDFSREAVNRGPAIIR